MARKNSGSRKVTVQKCGKSRIKAEAFPYKEGGKAFDLCCLEKMHITLGTKGVFTKRPPRCILLNKRSEIIAKCPHKRSFTLAQA